jgi:outer membrane protein OmpA-like peptidoglycan-associated protein
MKRLIFALIASTLCVHTLAAQAISTIAPQTRSMSGIQATASQIAPSQPLGSQASSTDTPERWSNLRYGVFGGYNFNSHVIDFKEFVPSCCPRPFANTMNTSLTFGALTEFPIWGGLGISLRAAYSPLSTTFIRTGDSLRTRIGSSAPRSVPISFQAVTSLGSIDFEPALTFRPIAGLSIYAGARLSYFVQASFNQFERIEDPNVTYETGTNTRALASGRIPTIRAFSPFLIGGVSYEIPVTPKGNITVAPEAFYVFPLTSILTDQTWRITSIRAGVSVRFAPEAEKTLEPVKASTSSPATVPAPTRKDTRTARPDPTKPPSGVFAARVASVTALAVSSTGTMQTNPNPIIEIEEFDGTRSRPVLPVVFFDEQSSEIPNRYQKIKSADRAKFLLDIPAQNDPLAAYYQVLNVIGKRLGLYPKAKITLIGFADALREQGSQALAIKRADKIKAYLKDVWKVDDKRITVKAAGAQEGIASGLSAGAAAEEQRRVEIQSDTPDVVDELRTNERTRTARPSALRIKLDIQAPAGLKDWRLEAVQAGEKMKRLKVFRGNGTAPDMLEWPIATSTLDSLPSSKDDVVLRLEATDNDGKTIRAPFVFIPADLITPESKRDEGEPDQRTDIFAVYGDNTAKAFSATDSSALRGVQKIKTAMKPTSTVNITGFSDSGASNPQQSSEARAKSIAALVNAPKASVQGKGASTLYDNALPEGRWYNRVVQVEVKSPTR